MDGKQIIKLAADLAAGSITTAMIHNAYGAGVLSSVLGVGAGIAVGGITDRLLDELDDHTGIVGDAAGLLDDAIGGFTGLFD